MQEDKIKELEAEIARLRKQLDELQESSFNHFDMFTTRFVEHDRDLGDLYSFLIPALEKLYPGFVPTNQHLDAILKRKSAPPAADSDKKDA
jgi:hypothetical protein